MRIKNSSITNTVGKVRLNRTVIGIVSNGKRTIIEMVFLDDVLW